MKYNKAAENLLLNRICKNCRYRINCSYETYRLSKDDVRFDYFCNKNIFKILGCPAVLTCNDWEKTVDVPQGHYHNFPGTGPFSIGPSRASAPSSSTSSAGITGPPLQSGPQK